VIGLFIYENGFELSVFRCAIILILFVPCINFPISFFSFISDDANAGTAGEVKIGSGDDSGTVAPGSLAELINGLRVGAQKLVVAPRNDAWLAELDVEADDKVWFGVVIVVGLQ
jgi:hypothetical protein